MDFHAFRKRTDPIHHAIVVIVLFLLILIPPITAEFGLNELTNEIDDPSLTNIEKKAQFLAQSSAGHVYPYMATAVTLGCLLATIMLIICCGPNLPK